MNAKSTTKVKITPDTKMEGRKSQKRRRRPSHHSTNKNNKSSKTVKSVEVADEFPGWDLPHSNNGRNDKKQETTNNGEKRNQRQRKPSSRSRNNNAHSNLGDRSHTGGRLNDNGNSRKKLHRRDQTKGGNTTGSTSTKSKTHHSNSSSTIKRSNNNRLTLSWPSNHAAVPLDDEEAMVPNILLYGERERGMMKTQPPKRIKYIRNACKKHNMTLEQALSLRRHHIKYHNPYMSMTALGLGNPDDIREAAILFEDSVSAYLKACRVPFLTEEEQKQRFEDSAQPGDLMPPTPDFMMEEPTLLVLDYDNDGEPSSNHNPKKHHNRGTRVKSQMINWIEAKMFYGASTIPAGTKNAAGGILPTAKKYVDAYGPGAFVFSLGFGSEVRKSLEGLNIVVLDAYPLDCSRMRTHQRKWCGNKDGVILP